MLSGHAANQTVLHGCGSERRAGWRFNTHTVIFVADCNAQHGMSGMSALNPIVATCDIESLRTEVGPNNQCSNKQLRYPIGQRHVTSPLKPMTKSTYCRSVYLPNSSLALTSNDPPCRLPVLPESVPEVDNPCVRAALPLVSESSPAVEFATSVFSDTTSPTMAANGGTGGMLAWDNLL